MARNLRVFWNIRKDSNVFLLDFGALIVKLKSWMKYSNKDSMDLQIYIGWIYQIVSYRLCRTSFLPFVPNLQILCLAHCTNLVDKELKFLSQCKYLDQIDLSFTFITGRGVIQHIVTNHNINLTSLDMRGTQVSVENCSSILKRFSETLLFFSINRPQFDTEKQHLEEIAANYSDCFISFWKKNHFCKEHCSNFQVSFDFLI